MESSILQILPVYKPLTDRIAEMEREIEREFGLKVSLQVRALEHEFEMDVITRLVSDTLKIPMNRIIGEKRLSDDATGARQVAVYLIGKYLPKMTDADIAFFFNRERSSISRSVQKVNDLLSVNDRRMTRWLTKCETALQQKINSYDNENELHKAE